MDISIMINHGSANVGISNVVWPPSRCQGHEILVVAPDAFCRSGKSGWRAWIVWCSMMTGQGEMNRQGCSSVKTETCWNDVKKLRKRFVRSGLTNWKRKGTLQGNCTMKL